MAADAKKEAEEEVIETKVATKAEVTMVKCHCDWKNYLEISALTLDLFAEPRYSCAMNRMQQMMSDALMKVKRTVHKLFEWS